MLRTLHHVSAFCFFVLGAVALAGVVLMRKNMATLVIKNGLAVVDLPLLVSGITFAGMSLYLSLRRDESVSWPLLLLIFAPLLSAFGVFAWMNFSLPFAE